MPSPGLIGGAVLIALGTLATSTALGHGDTAQAVAGAAVRKQQKDWGIAGDAKSARRTVEITMSDTMRFLPDLIEVRQGETIRIRLRNDGKVLHEFVLGTKSELDAHAAAMARFPDMQHHEPYMVHVKPGATGVVVWTFNRAGEFAFACLVAGHYQAGMVGKVRVAAAAR